MKRPLVLLLCCCSVLTLVGTKAYGLAESTGPDGANAQAVHDLGQIGDGVKIGLIAGRNVYADHEAFSVGRAVNYDFSTVGIQPFDHDTWMAGIAISGGGALYPDDIGVAPGAEIHCGRIADDYNLVDTVFFDNALANLIDVRGCRVIMTGVAFGDDPCGQSTWTLMYDYYAYDRDVIFAIGAGNGYSVLQVFADAYNGITTGGAVTSGDDVYDKVGLISSSGTTWDGRRKPDVVAPANRQTVPHIGPSAWWTPPWDDGRTSLAGPHTAGIAALLLRYADQTPNGSDGEKEVVKAVIVNSAFPNIDAKTGASTNPVDSNNVWHKDRGYGRVDALRSYEVLAAGQIFKGVTTSQDKGWAYASMSSKTQVDSYFIEGQKNDRLVLTVIWNRQVIRNGPFNYSDEVDPKFRLNLTIKDSNGVSLYSEYDALNNLKKVERFLPRDDTYEVVLTNPDTKNNRSYGLAFELIPPLVADFNLDYVVDNDDLGVLAQNWLQGGSEADATGEGDVNFRDFAVFAANRGSFNPLYH